MANENVDSKLIDLFEIELIKYGKKRSYVQPNNGHSYALGYILQMLKSGMFNEKDILVYMATFEGTK